MLSIETNFTSIWLDSVCDRTHYLAHLRRTRFNIVRIKLKFVPTSLKQFSKFCVNAHKLKKSHANRIYTFFLFHLKDPPYNTLFQTCFHFIKYCSL